MESDNTMIDIPDGMVSVTNIPEPPEGMEIVNIDVVVRVRRKRDKSKLA